MLTKHDPLKTQISFVGITSFAKNHFAEVHEDDQKISG
jgi:hypothetical protein